MRRNTLTTMLLLYNNAVAVVFFFFYLQFFKFFIFQLEYTIINSSSSSLLLCFFRIIPFQLCSSSCWCSSIQKMTHKHKFHNATGIIIIIHIEKQENKVYVRLLMEKISRSYRHHHLTVRCLIFLWISSK